MYNSINETGAQTPVDYPFISTGRLAQVANAMQIIRGVIGTPRTISGISNAQKEAAVFNGLHQAANEDAVLRSALVLAAEPKLLDKVRDTFGEQQSLQYSAKRNRTFYIDNDPEDIKAAVETFDKMFGQTGSPANASKHVTFETAPQPPTIAKSTEQTERKAPGPNVVGHPPTKPVVSNVQQKTTNLPPIPVRPQVQQLTIGNVQPNKVAPSPWNAHVQATNDPRPLTGQTAPQTLVANVQPKLANVAPQVVTGHTAPQPLVGNVQPKTDSGPHVVNSHPPLRSTVGNVQPKTVNATPSPSNLQVPRTQPLVGNVQPKTTNLPPIPSKPQMPGANVSNAQNTTFAENAFVAKEPPVKPGHLAQVKTQLDLNHLNRYHK